VWFYGAFSCHENRSEDGNHEFNGAALMDAIALKRSEMEERKASTSASELCGAPQLEGTIK